MSMSLQPAIDYIDKDGFRANVGIVLTRGSGEVFLGGRVGGRGWQFPQGGVNRGEQVEDALYRELREEIGLERQDTARLRNLLAAFLRGCDACPDVMNDALISAVPLHSAAKDEQLAAPGQLALLPEPLSADVDSKVQSEPNE